jgi:integrase/recombinase XerD
MTVADVYWQHRRLWVRLNEKGGKEHSMPCHHHLETYLQDYIEAARLADDREGPLFRTTVRRTGVLSGRPMTQSDAWRMLHRTYGLSTAFVQASNGQHRVKLDGVRSDAALTVLKIEEANPGDLD